MKNVHQGAVSKIKFYSDGVDKNIILSVGQKDGVLAIHDMRSHSCVSKGRVHGGSINFLDTSLSGFILTGSADRSLKTHDIFNSFKPVNVM